MKTYYQLLEIESTASGAEIKRAFRGRIARYHPDKVQHLGQEFQDLASERAAELTEAYRVLSNEQTRAEYDRSLTLKNDAMAAPPAATPSRPHASPADAPAADAAPAGEPFSRERATRDQFVRNATFNRVRRALEPLAAGGYDASEVRGFDFALLPKSRLFGRARGPRLVGRLVARVDPEAIAGAWGDARRWAANDDVCVFLMGPEIATAGELARAIADQRHRSRTSRVILIPVDARTWDAHLPTDAPPIAKTVLERLKTGT